MDARCLQSLMLMIWSASWLLQRCSSILRPRVLLARGWRRAMRRLRREQVKAASVWHEVLDRGQVRRPEGVRVRTGDFRIVYEVQDEVLVVLLLAAGRDIYRGR